MSLPVARTGFPTTGSVSLVDLPTKPVEYSVEILARASNAGVDPYTVLVGQTVAQLFRLGHIGRSNVQNALSKLKSFGSVGNAIQFGVGVESFTRTLAKTEQGMTLIAIAAAFSECYHEDVAAEIMHELVLALHPPDRLTPALHEWLMVVKACQGTLAATNFPVRAEVFMSLDKPPVGIVSSSQTVIDPADRSRAAAADIAAALLAIGRVSMGEFKSISIIGGADAGILATIAEWLLDLKILISNNDNETLYSSCSDVSETQINIVLNGQIQSESSAVQLTSTTYHLEDVSHLLRTTENKHQAQAGGRLHWDKCLSLAYGRGFDELMERPELIGSAIGSAARIFKAIANREPGLDRRMTPDNALYGATFDSVGGLGFVQMIVWWFVELKDLEKHASNAATVPLPEAESHYKHVLGLIRLKCECYGCRTESRTEGYSKHLCHVLLVQTIIGMGLMLSGLVLEDKLNPTRSGLLQFYQYQEEKIRRKDLEPETYDLTREIGSIAAVFRAKTACFGSGETAFARHFEPETTERRLFDALQLFIPRAKPRISHRATAVAEAGVCVYLDLLRDIRLDKETVSRVRVVSGRIERSQKPYYAVQDRTQLNFVHCPPLQEMARSLGGVERTTLVVRETIKNLEVDFELQARVALSTKFKSVITFGPGDFNFYAKATLQRKTGCSQPLSNEFPDYVNLEAVFQEFENGSNQISLCRGNQLSRCAFLAASFLSDMENYSIVQGEDCFQCCMEAAQTYCSSDEARHAHCRSVIIIAE